MLTLLEPYVFFPLTIVISAAVYIRTEGKQDNVGAWHVIVGGVGFALLGASLGVLSRETPGDVLTFQPYWHWGQAWLAIGYWGLLVGVAKPACTAACVRPNYCWTPPGAFMLIEVQIVNAFIDGAAGGNPAGVVVDANALTAAQKLEVAKRVGLSETAFVSASDSATIKLDFFTPTRQIAHCGHATIATFSLLRQLGIISEGRLSKETIDGNRDILVDGGMAFMEQRAPKYAPVFSTSELGRRAIASLRLTQAQLLTGIDPFVVNTGNSFLIMPLPDECSVAELRPDLGLIASLSDELDLIGYYVFSTATRVPGRHAGARMFAPRFGIPEEAGTGMAAGPLACFLHDHLGVQDREIFIEQGWLMQPPSPSVIKVTLELAEGKISRLMAGGTARAVSSMRVEI